MKSVFVFPRLFLLDFVESKLVVLVVVGAQSLQCVSFFFFSSFLIIYAEVLHVKQNDFFRFFSIPVVLLRTSTWPHQSFPARSTHFWAFELLHVPSPDKAAFISSYMQGL